MTNPQSKRSDRNSGGGGSVAAADDSKERSSPSKYHSRLARNALLLAWAVNLASLVAAVLWVYCDGRSWGHIARIYYQLGLSEPLLNSSDVGAARNSLGGRVALVGLAAAACSFMVMFAGLLIGPARFRSTRTWLLFIAITSGWLGLFAAWSEVYWRGQQNRVDGSLQAFEALAEKLSANWPRSDGEIEGVGAFLAYPHGDPAMLLFLGAGTVPNSPIRISAVERSAGGVLRFELGASEGGAWLERHLDGGVPGSFIGGLESSYAATRYEQLAPNWFLVRYRWGAANDVTNR
jgi:hypothetical protein